MPVVTAVYLDFQDPACYRVWRWLSLLPEREHVDIRPYSVDRIENESRNPWDRESSSWCLELLALGEVARERGRDCHLAFVDAAFRAVHDEQWDLSSPEAWLALCAEIGMDLHAFVADGERWRAEVGLWHQEAEDEYGLEGVPNLVFDNGQALYVRLQESIEDESAARRLLADLTDLVVQRVEEVRRSG